MPSCEGQDRLEAGGCGWCLVRETDRPTGSPWHELPAGDAVRLAEVAHIVAASEEGPRGNAEVETEELRGSTTSSRSARATQSSTGRWVSSRRSDFGNGRPRKRPGIVKHLGGKIFHSRAEAHVERRVGSLRATRSLRRTAPIARVRPSQTATRLRVHQDETIAKINPIVRNGAPRPPVGLSSADSPGPANPLVLVWSLKPTAPRDPQALLWPNGTYAATAHPVGVNVGGAAELGVHQSRRNPCASQDRSVGSGGIPLVTAHSMLMNEIDRRRSPPR